MSQKPIKTHKQLGVDVSIDVEKIEVDKNTNEVIHSIGRSYGRTQPGMNYCGSVVIHIYKESQSLYKTSHSLSNITNICMVEDISEQAMLTVWQNAAIRIRSYFNPAFTHKTTDNKDQRGIVK